jgi:hypothetical protein
MSKEQPWKGSSLNAYQLLLWNYSIITRESDHPQSWILKSEVIREECLKRSGPTHDKLVVNTLVKEYSLTMRQI